MCELADVLEHGVLERSKTLLKTLLYGICSVSCTEDESKAVLEFLSNTKISPSLEDLLFELVSTVYFDIKQANIRILLLTVAYNNFSIHSIEVLQAR